MNRIIGFDFLRFFMVLFVVMLHGAMSYMAYVPQWQYVINPQNSLFFTALVIILDSFPMSVLFFLAGYFAPPSFEKKGFGDFLKDKFLHIAAPAFLGIIFIAPFFAYASLISLKFPPMPADIFIKNAFFGPFYQQGVYWFLTTLFAFFVLFAIFKRFYKKSIVFNFSVLSVFILFTLSFISYILSALYIKPAVDWLNIGFVLYFQPARIIGYGALFVFGAACWANKYFIKTKFKLNFLFIIPIISMTALLLRAIIFAPSISPLANIVLESFFYNASCISLTFLLLALSSNIKSGIRIIGEMAGFSYGIYYLHMIVLMPSIYLLIPFSMPIFFKWLISFVFTLVLCFFIAKYILKKAPLFNKMF